ncbi:unnamed protein product, partial [Amoebophrya sp. A120]|eukprot:GSA120T00001153001.1
MHERRGARPRRAGPPALSIRQARGLSLGLRADRSPGRPRRARPGTRPCLCFLSDRQAWPGPSSSSPPRHCARLGQPGPQAPPAQHARVAPGQFPGSCSNPPLSPKGRQHACSPSAPGGRIPAAFSARGRRENPSWKSESCRPPGRTHPRQA